jgi:DNA ligase (NAD+)
MSLAEAKKRHNKLKEQLEHYDYEYHVLDAPTVTDAVYDGLRKEMRAIEAEFPELKTTQRIAGKPLAGFSKVAHSTRMLSLNDVFNREDVEAWVARMESLHQVTRMSILPILKWMV